MPRRFPIHVILNPAGGSSQPDVVYQTLASRFEPSQYDVYETSANDDVTQVTAAAIDAGYRTIVAAGGDGTVHEVASAIHPHIDDVVMGIIPSGTGNVVARALDIPLDSVAAIALLADGGTIRPIDYLLVNGHVFISHVSAGIYTDAIADTSVAAKQRFGTVAYVASGLQKIAKNQSYRFEFTVDEVPYELEGSQLLIASMGDTGLSLLKWGVDIKPDDGMMHIIGLSATSLPGYLRMIGDALREKHQTSDHITTIAACKRVVIKNAHAVSVTGNGELIEAGNVTVDLFSRKLQVIAPAA